MGTIKRDTQIRAIKNAKDELSHPQNARTRAPAHLSSRSRAQIVARPTPWPRARVPSRPTPSGARTQTPPRPTPLASSISSVSPDPSRARSPTPRRPVRARLPTHGARTHDVTGAVIPITQQGVVATVPTTLGTAALPLSLQPYLSHCVTLPLLPWCTASQ